MTTHDATDDDAAGGPTAHIDAVFDHDVFVLDLDGTVYLDGEAIPGSAGAVDRLRAAGRQVFFLTNNSTRTRQSFAQVLQDIGIDAVPDDIVSSASVTAAYLEKHHPGGHLLVVGEQGLAATLEAAGFTTAGGQRETPPLSAAPGFDCVVVGLDRRLDYDRLSLAFRAIEAGAGFVATNADASYPVPDGYLPGAGCMVGALETATQTEAVVVGKPSATMGDLILSQLDAPPERVVMVGDRLETDIQMGTAAGMGTALVLSGVTDRERLRAHRRGGGPGPDWVLGGLADLQGAADQG